MYERALLRCIFSPWVYHNFQFGSAFGLVGTLILCYFYFHSVFFLQILGSFILVLFVGHSLEVECCIILYRVSAATSFKLSI